MSLSCRSYRFSAPAKLNLALRIVGRRPDGFHRLWTVMTFFPLYDTLTITYPANELSLTCEPPVTTDPEQNLVLRAARLLQQHAGVMKGARLHVTKVIPHGAGLGGGSSDAATTLLALNELWQLHLPLPQLLQIGVTLGADIPIFLAGVASLAEGVGELLTPLPQLATPDMLVVNPGVVLATAHVFQNFAKQRNRSDQPNNAMELPETIQHSVLPVLCNDLQVTAAEMAPIITVACQELQVAGAQATMMSGSGSSLFGLFVNRQHAVRAKRVLQQAHPDWQIFYGQTFNIHPFAKEWKSGIE